MKPTVTYIYGKHAVLEACTRHAKAVRTCYLSDSIDPHVRTTVQKSGVALEVLNPNALPGDVPEDAVHQGFVASIKLDALLISFDAFIEKLTVHDDTALVLLGEIQDPHNVGAIIRSAAAFGMTAVLVPEHRQAQITGTVVKASAGMVFTIPLVSIGNVNHTIQQLKESGFWIYGLDGEARTTVQEEQFEKPSVFILGNEGSGIRQKTLEHCDIPLRIPMVQHVESLNASVAAAIVCYAWSTKHGRVVK
jgi:23S rRNA (guanosine2251-2'-O)-methyltransferase